MASRDRPTRVARVPDRADGEAHSVAIGAATMRSSTS
jgi:hypothetical protein